MTTAQISLEEVKEHLRMEVDDTEEDVQIQGLIEAALEVCQTHIGMRFTDGLSFTPAIRIGCLMYVAFLHAHRSMVSEIEKSEVPLTIGVLWSVYREPGVY